MFGPAIIIFRETLEAALVIGIIAAATRGVPRRGLWLLLGVIAGIIGSGVIAGLTETIADMADGSGQELFNAAVLGIAVVMLAWHHGASLGLVMYFGLMRIPLKWFFSVTGWMLVLLAAGLAGQMARFLIQADWLPSLVTPLWDTSAILSADSLLGRILHALVGYEPSPSAMQMLFYVATLAVILSAASMVRRQQTITRNSLKTS